MAVVSLPLPPNFAYKSIFPSPAMCFSQPVRYRSHVSSTTIWCQASQQAIINSHLLLVWKVYFHRYKLQDVLCYFNLKALFICILHRGCDCLKYVHFHHAVVEPWDKPLLSEMICKHLILSIFRGAQRCMMSCSLQVWLFDSSAWESPFPSGYFLIARVSADEAGQTWRSALLWFSVEFSYFSPFIPNPCAMYCYSIPYYIMILKFYFQLLLRQDNLRIKILNQFLNAPKGLRCWRTHRHFQEANPASSYHHARLLSFHPMEQWKFKINQETNLQTEEYESITLFFSPE